MSLHGKIYQSVIRCGTLLDEVSFVIGGPQGSGIETSAVILTYALARAGYGVLVDREYFSNIKGRHSYALFRVSSRRVPKALKYLTDFLVALDAETVFTHYKSLRDGGVLVYDVGVSSKRFDTILSIEEELRNRLAKEFKELGLDGTLESLVNYLRRHKNVFVVGLDYSKILEDFSKESSLKPHQASRYLSSIPTSAVSTLVGLRESVLSFAYMRRFNDLKVVEENIKLSRVVTTHLRKVYESPPLLKSPETGLNEVLVVSGNDVVAMGKVVGGLRYQAYYPITPAADESFTLETYSEFKVGDEHATVVVLQTEDEIAAVTSAIGAALTGVRAATATSGPGFSLMVEGLGWAGMNEVPVVITYYQRGGPSTGLPTRGSQSDLLFTLFASHGEFPRIVIASGDHEEAFKDSVEILNLTEKYQVPGIHLLDKFLANSLTTLIPPELSEFRVDRGVLTKGSEDYVRFDLSKGPLSPRAFLGSNAIIYYTGDEHNEAGHISEDPINRVNMYTKRMLKLELMSKEIPEDFLVKFYGDLDADVLLVGWGYVKGVALEVMNELNKEGSISCAYLHLRGFSPFPIKFVENILKAFEGKAVVALEHSYLAQVSKVIAMNTGLLIRKEIVKFTGRPMFVDEVILALTKIVKGLSNREVLTLGE